MLVLATMTLGCSAPQRRPCAKDIDCKGDRICDPGVGACVAPNGSGVAPVATVANQTGSAQAVAIVAVKPNGSPPFAMFGGDAAHTGRCAGPAPATTPTQRWAFTTGGAIAGSPTVGPDGTIYITSHDGGLYAVAADGKQKWKFSTGDRSWSTPAVALDGTVYVGSDDDHLYAVNAQGALKWRLRLGDCDPAGFGPESSRCDADGGPTIGPDGTIYVGGDGVYAVWADGTLRWASKMAK